MEINYKTELIKDGASFFPENLDIREKGILAIDSGLYLGWAYKQGEYIAAGYIDLSNEQSLYGTTYKAITLFINKFKPKKAVIEKFFLMPRAFETRTIEQRGAIKAVFETINMPWEEIHTATVRKHLGIKGKPTDITVRESVSAYYNIPTQYYPDIKSKRKKNFRPDVFDALALLIAEESNTEEKRHKIKK